MIEELVLKNVFVFILQIFYHDAHDSNGYRVELNGLPFLQCVTMEPSNGGLMANTCYTSGITYMKNGDKIYVTDLGSERFALLADAQSFFGLVRLSDAKINSQQHPEQQFETLN